MKNEAGQAGDINITGQSVFVTDGSELTAQSSKGGGNSGNININAKDTVEISGREPILSPPRQDRSTTYFYTTLTTLSDKDANGTAGNININTGKLRVLDGAVIAADTKSDFQGGDIMVNAKVVELFDGGQILTTARSRGNAGNIFLKVGDGIVLSGTNPNYAEDKVTFGEKVEAVNQSSGLFANTGDKSSGNGGSIEINSTNLSINNGAGIGINSSGQGSAGRFLNINAGDSITLANGFITSGLGSQAVGQGGEIKLNAGSLSLTNNSEITAQSQGKGNAGNINIDAPNGSVSISDSSGLLTQTSSDTGKGGIITVTTKAFQIGNNGTLNATTNSASDGGSVIINANTFDAVSGGKLQTTTFGSGNAGNISVNVGDRFSLSGTGTDLLANTAPESSGKGGSIEINSTNLSINNGASIGINSSGQGSAGSFLNINAGDSITLANGFITSGLGSQAIGQGGEIKLNAGSLSLTDGAKVVASTLGQGDAGRINAQVKDRVSLTNNSQIQSTVEPGAIGQGGEINLTAGKLSLTDGAKVVASTSGQGNAGRINAQVKDRVTLTNNSQIQSTVESTATGNGTQINISGRSLFFNNNSQITAQSQGTGNAGNINIDASTFDAVSGGKLLTTTSGSGNAGNISVNLSDRLSVDGTDTGLFANTEVGSSGNGGSIFIDPRTVLIENGAGVTVGSRGTGTGGNIQIQADILKLDNKAFLSAETASTQGGNIGIQSQGLLLLRHNSQISTNAGNARQGGDGGNITINSPNGFIVAVPNEDSNISANAFTGSGGRVNITASGIYGIESRPRPTELSDITASSERGVQGTIEINTPIVDPNRGLLQLTAGVVNTPRLVSSSCAAFDKKGSEFIVTGRGGLPLSPDDFLSNDVIWTDTRLSATTAQNQPRTPAAKLSIPKAVEIVPATGWVFNGKGEVTLISSAPDATASVSVPTCAKQ